MKKIAVTGCWILAVVLTVISRCSSAFSQWYSLHIYPIFVQTLGRFLSIFPFSAAEILLIGGGLILVFRWLYLVYLCFKRKRRGAEVIRETAEVILSLGGIFALSFTLFAGINYQRPSFSQEEGLICQDYSREELVELCREMAIIVDIEAENLLLDETGCARKPDRLEERAVKAMESLGEQYQSLSGYYPKPKPILLSRLWSLQKVTGVYSPFTIEANYNTEIPAYSLGHTICHELSHLKGFMREDEANFVAWLACMESEDAGLRYSGALVGLVYATNALYRYDPDTYREILSGLGETALADLHYNSLFWRQFDGPVAEVHDKVNDVYLKANSQTEGVESYGHVVDLMLAYRRGRE